MITYRFKTEGEMISEFTEIESKAKLTYLRGSWVDYFNIARGQEEMGNWLGKKIPIKIAKLIIGLEYVSVSWLETHEYDFFEKLLHWSESGESEYDADPYWNIKSRAIKIEINGNEMKKIDGISKGSIIVIDNKIKQVHRLFQGKKKFAVSYIDDNVEKFVMESKIKLISKSIYNKYK